MIHLTAAQGKYYFSDVVILLSGESTDVDEQALTLGQLEGLKDGYETSRLLMTVGDYQKLLEALESKTSSGAGGKVGSVNGEIGEVVLDASEIDFTSGGSIEAKFGELSNVAFSGSYLDLTNRPGGTGEPFSVIDWDPYASGLIEYAFEAGNSSTQVVDGTITQILPDSIPMILKDVGMPNSDAISFNNTTPTTITCNIIGTEPYARGFAIDNIVDFSLKPLDTFAYDNTGTTKGATVSFLIFQMEDGEDINTLTIQDLMNRPRNIGINFNGLYQNESNGYTTVSWSVSNNGSTVYSNNTPMYGNFDLGKIDLSTNMANFGDYDIFDLSTAGFDPNKPYAAVGVVQINPTVFDVTTSFNLELSRITKLPEVKNIFPEHGEITVNRDEEINFTFSDEQDSQYFGLALAYSQGFLNAYDPVNGQFDLTSDYLDPSNNVTLKIDGYDFQLKNYTTSNYDTIYTRSIPFTKVVIEILSHNFGSNKTSWYIDTISWNRTETINGTLPVSAIDGSTLKVINNGMYNDTLLYVNDIVTPYDNLSKFLLHRVGKTVSNDVNTAGSNPVSGDAVIAVLPTAVSLKGTGLSSESDVLSISLSQSSDNLTTFEGNNLVTRLPTVVTPFVLREAAQHFSYTSNVYADLSIRSIFTIQSPSYNVTITLSNLDQSHPTDTNLVIAKTVTFIIVDANSINWPSSILWANDEPPTITAGQYLVVTGIVVRSTNIDVTNSKLLCSYSYYTK